MWGEWRGNLPAEPVSVWDPSRLMKLQKNCHRCASFVNQKGNFSGCCRSFSGLIQRRNLWASGYLNTIQQHSFAEMGLICLSGERNRVWHLLNFVIWLLFDLMLFLLSFTFKILIKWIHIFRFIYITSLLESVAYGAFHLSWKLDLCPRFDVPPE